MKLKFTQEELSWLNYGVTLMARVMAGKKEDALYTAAKKMRYKFTPNASTVFLTGKERELLAQIADFRMTSLRANTAGSPAAMEEEQLVTTILKKVSQ